ncbi:transposase [Planotetraspora silvatica]|uniref:Transposase n=3 Tax=Planotetraspora silvatica TaxID=234614 RepID=A0A8J3UK03_9ACTN|nr:transposase [Planotetraspora silvatica]
MVFPHLRFIHIDRFERTAGGLRIWGRAREMTATCTACGAVSGRVHGRYERRVDDLAISGRPVVIRLQVRRFVCVNTACRRKTFVEQVPGLTRRYGRRSLPLAEVLTAIALALAGRAGARLADALGVVTSRSTLLRLIRALPEPHQGNPTVVGIDDFALRRRRVYGTVLIDMVTHRPIEVLVGRDAKTVSEWLAAHPQVEVVCRDRASAYAEAVTTAAPQAIQVADRWHLWHNLVEAVDKCVVQHRACLRQPSEGDHGGALPQLGPAPEIETNPEVATGLNTRIQERYTAVQELVAQGHSIRGIMRELGLARGTVRRYARPANVEELLTSAARPSNLDDFKLYLHERFAAGTTRPIHLFAELQAQGYTGSYPNIRDYVRRLRRWAQRHPATAPPPAVHHVVGWITRHPANLEEEHARGLAQILDRCPELAQPTAHVRAFAVMMSERHGDQLHKWLTSARASDLPGLNSFIRGVERDQAAVTAGLTHAWSSGPVEGHVNRIKMIKRQMFGRANFDLLRKRILLTP